MFLLFLSMYPFFSWKHKRKSHVFRTITQGGGGEGSEDGIVEGGGGAWYNREIPSKRDVFFVIFIVCERTATFWYTKGSQKAHSEIKSYSKELQNSTVRDGNYNTEIYACQRKKWGFGLSLSSLLRSSDVLWLVTYSFPRSWGGLRDVTIVNAWRAHQRTEVCIKTRSPPASLPIQGQPTKHKTENGLFIFLFQFNY